MVKKIQDCYYSTNLVDYIYYIDYLQILMVVLFYSW